MRISLTLIITFVVLLLAACGGAGQEEIQILPTATAVQTETPSPTASPTETAPVLTPTPELRQSRQDERDAMVQDGVIGWGIQDEAVIEAMRAVPRHEFVPDEDRELAYENHPLPIGYGQTISQPYIVGLMTEAIEPRPGFKVLEIGTGSGYQASILAQIVDQVYSIEIIEPLAVKAEEAFARVGYSNIAVQYADGYFGWEEHAPYDAIVVTAALDHVPQPLVQQLKIGGKMVIPVGPVGGYQSLWLITRVAEDEVSTADLGGVRFVPLTREKVSETGK